MKKTRFVPALLFLFCSLVLVGGILAAPDPVITREVFGSAGEPVTDGNLYILNGTLGEPIVSNRTVETNYGLSSGYWVGGVTFTEGTTYPIYLPLLFKNS